jgi:hypothetical protein
VDSLHAWRKKVWYRDFPKAVFGPSAILKDSTLEALSSVGPIQTLKELERVVGENWTWFGPYGNELLDELVSLSIPKMIPKPKERRKASTTKRKQNAQDREDGAPKRTRKEAPEQVPTSAQSPTTVNPLPTPGPSFYGLQPPMRVQPSPIPHYGFQTHHPYYPSSNPHLYYTNPHPYFTPYHPNLQNPLQSYQTYPNYYQNTPYPPSQPLQSPLLRFIHHDPQSGHPPAAS